MAQRRAFLYPSPTCGGAFAAIAVLALHEGKCYLIFRFSRRVLMADAPARPDVDPARTFPGQRRLRDATASACARHPESILAEPRGIVPELADERFSPIRRRMNGDALSASLRE